jgi:hypothetical protein
VNERGRKFFIFLFSYLLPHGQSLEGFATGKSLLSSRIALKAPPPNDQQIRSKWSRLDMRRSHSFSRETHGSLPTNSTARGVCTMRRRIELMRRQSFAQSPSPKRASLWARGRHCSLAIARSSEWTVGSLNSFTALIV